MPVDIVIDTNVLVHANNQENEHFESSNKFIHALFQSECKLCVDENFDIDESKNKSYIFSEYLNFLTHGTLGFTLLFHMATNNRIKPISKKITEKSVGRKINQYVKDKTDRCFVKVALNSQEKILVSHDYRAISASNRPRLKSELEIIVFNAADYIEC